MGLQELLGVELPLVQAPMAGVQGSALAIAVSNAGGLGSLPCAMLGPDAMRAELSKIRAQTSRPYNVNFFCHRPPAPDATREALWRQNLAHYYREFDVDPASIPAGPGRLPFDTAAARIYAEVRADLERRGTPLDGADLRIAAIALAHGHTVVTANVRHFGRVPGLPVENWLGES